MKTKKLTAEIDHDLNERLKTLAGKRKMTLSQIVTRMIENTLTADRIAKEMRG